MSNHSFFLQIKNRTNTYKTMTTHNDVLKGIKAWYQSDLYKYKHVYSEEQITKMFIEQIQKLIKRDN